MKIQTCYQINMTEYITLAVCKELLDMQDKSFRSLVTMLSNDMKTEIKQLQSDVIDIKNSLQYSGKDIEDLQKRIKSLDIQLLEIQNRIDSHDSDLGHVVNKQDYLENQSRRNNLRITGVKEEGKESWEETESIVKAKIKDLLHIDEELTIERAHRVNRSNSSRHHDRRSSAFGNSDPRPIVAKFLNWKDKEKVLASARKIRPQGIKFVQDFSQMVMDRRKDQIPKMLDARSKGKIAYFVRDRLIIKEKRQEGSSNSVPVDSQKDDREVSFTLAN